MMQHPVLERSGFSVCLGLERFSEFVHFAGSPALSIPSVQIAGTNGKGSVTKILGSILKDSGLKVGMYTSPHLSHINERIVINGVEISDEDLDICLERVDELAQLWSLQLDLNPNGQNTLTYFELLTAAALFYFEQEKVDIILWEVGLGGRLDATSVVSPLVSIIVSISFDHMNYLGRELADIAMEKGGIIKKETPVLTGDLPQEAHRVIRMIAMDLDAPLFRLGEHFHISSSTPDVFSFRFDDLHYSDLELSLLGAHQQKNAAIAITAASFLKQHMEVDLSLVSSSLKKVVHEGRLEWVNNGSVLLDCAHNGDGAAQLVNFLNKAETLKKRVLLLGVSKDKDVHSIWVQLEGIFERILLFQSSHHRALAPEDILGKLSIEQSNDSRIVCLTDLNEVSNWVDFEREELVVAGSVFLVGEARRFFRA